MIYQNTQNENSTTIRDFIEEDEHNMPKYGYGSVYFNQTRGCYQAAYYTNEFGQKKRKILSAPSYEEAMFKLAQLKSAKMAFDHEEEVPTPKEYHTIRSIWNYILTVQKSDVKEKTKKWYEDIGGVITDTLGDKYIEALTSQDVQGFVSSLKYCVNGKLASESRVKKVSEQLKLIIRYAMNEGYISKNPFNDNIKRPKGIELDARETAFTLDEVDTLLKSIKHSESVVLRTLVPCLLLSGMRIGEFLTLGYSDLNREDGTIHICHSINIENGKRVLGTTKTEAGNRVIPVPPIFFDIVDNWHDFVCKSEKRMANIKARGNEDIIFVGNNGEIRNPDCLRSDFVSVLNRIGLKKPNTSFHGLRRTYATLLTWSGVNVETVAKLLGHKPDLDDGCEVARSHYIKENENIISENKRLALEQYMAYIGDVFIRNIHFTHLKKSVNR